MASVQGGQRSEVCILLPGEYSLHTSVFSQGAVSTFGQAELSVTNRNLEVGLIPLRGTEPQSGEVTLAGKKSGASLPKGLQIELQPRGRARIQGEGLSPK